ncbi:DUF305 domain-containing protein [Aeromicrobium sp. SMF47]|uniref:DUF305 domain-containing protein n=1 Tax=Aeromicrobium yanjiei TaxID=2662028 RepID=A0A5Q2MJZ8_9ACTN|nr:DUF305 domain-containing protein [Aeromicrobium yanjiei]MRJ75707.1 DUF305 domain-containing protein [Aeromicrobium yanjiei]QGG43038.1 DUF305 domain-containing protein [Aeromicrobium yanjiei]
MKTMLTGLVLLLLVSACAGGTKRSDSSPSDHNAADVEFLQQMIPHHEQALEMTEIAGRSKATVVIELADRIEAGQQPEIERMRGWLDDWDVDERAAAEHGSDRHDDMAGDGMMTRAQMDELESMGDGSAFTSSWIAMMTEHHEGAIEMARTELAEGSNPAAKKLAREIIATQQREIDEMSATGVSR